MIQRKERPDPATLMGAGRLEEVAEFVRANEIDLGIFDHELAPAQQKNLKTHWMLRSSDRTTLILDIFAQRAKTSEGRLQVELVQLKYRLPRFKRPFGTSLPVWAAVSVPEDLVRANWKATADISAEGFIPSKRSSKSWKNDEDFCASAERKMMLSA